MIEPCPIDSTLADDQFYQGFESLGANCEFGLVQRKFGAEPLGLLRWPTITVAGLVRGLRNRFAELSEISNLSLFPGPKNEWDIMTPNFSLHLYSKIGTVDEASLLNSAFRRIRFMRRSLLENLEDAEKVFVFKEWQFRMSEADIFNIWDELKRYNSRNRLLAVRLESPGNPSGTATQISDGLWVGHVELDARMSAEANVPFESWDRICRRVQIGR
jgi:hypothetical protein